MITSTREGRRANAMTGGRRLAGAVGVLVGLLVAGQSHAGTVRYVDDDGLDGFNCTNAPCTTISAAIADAKSPVTVIRVRPGTYVEQVVVPFGHGDPRRGVRQPPRGHQADRDDTDAPHHSTVGSRRRRRARRRPPATDLGRRHRPVHDEHRRRVLARAGRDLRPQRVGRRRPDRSSNAGRERTARLPGPAASASLVESGVKARSSSAGRSSGKSRFISKSVHFESFQKAGLVGIGPNTLVRLEDGDALRATRRRQAGAAVLPYGFEARQGRSRHDHQLDRDRRLVGAGRQARRRHPRPLRAAR